LDAKSGKLIVNSSEQTNVPNIFALGDLLLGKPELTPVAIRAGRLLAKRLFGGSSELCDYQNVPTTVFTPMEYGSCGLAEEDALAQYGEDVETFLQGFTPLEYTVPQRKDPCFAKLICLKSQNLRVIGIHILGPNAGEIVQGFSIALKLNACKSHFDDLIGIHPTCAEIFTTMTVTRSSGADFMAAGC